ncbi:hypothetical protein D3C81_1135540 [compost metagenome]
MLPLFWLFSRPSTLTSMSLSLSNTPPSLLSRLSARTCNAAAAIVPLIEVSAWSRVRVSFWLLSNWPPLLSSDLAISSKALSLEISPPRLFTSVRFFSSNCSGALITPPWLFSAPPFRSTLTVPPLNSLPPCWSRPWTLAVSVLPAPRLPPVLVT